MNNKITIALAGNPNSGKTTLFNALTGARQHIANYPGVTVEKKSGIVNHKNFEIQVVDLPGIYSLTAYSVEEVVSRNFLINERPDLVVDIVDASNLERNLYLAIQFKELGVPLIIALNMIDLAGNRGIVVDHDELSRLLGNPIVPMVARSNKGIDKLLDEVIEFDSKDREWQPMHLSYGMDIDQGIQEIETVIAGEVGLNSNFPARWLALKCLEGDREVNAEINKYASVSTQIESICERTLKHIRSTLEDDPEGIIADHRYGYITGITKKSVKRKIESRLNTSDRIDQVLTNRVIGPLIMLGILYLIYEFTFWASDNPVIWMERLFGGIKDVIVYLIPEGLLQSLLVSGLIDGVGGVLSFVPLIMFMFFAIAIMEDSGYMARVAYMLDRIMRWFGLHGNSVMALIVSGGISGGCAVPGVMATRTLRDPKERIATLLVVPFMNCGAKLPVFGVMIAAFFAKNEAKMMFVFTLMSWAFALFGAKIIRTTVLRGEKTPFVMELPPYRMPTLKGICIHTWERTWQYIKKAGTLILGISIILWAMMTFPEPDQSQINHYNEQRDNLRSSFLSSPGVVSIIRDDQMLAELKGRIESIREVSGSKKREIELQANDNLSLLAEMIISIQKGEQETDQIKDENYKSLALDYIEYKKRVSDLNAVERSEALKGTIAGRIGLGLEAISKWIGFDYRTNIALIGGFAAKEVIISTLGTAYSLGEGDFGEDLSLSERLKHDPGWNPLVAFTLILFMMLYVPCFITVIIIAKESSWAWAGFSILFNLIAAYTISLIVFRAGSMLGIGV